MVTHDLAVMVRNLTVKFDSFCAVDDISFIVERGSIFGFLGANGAGKTTTIRVLCGLLYPSNGTVEVAGINFKSELDEREIKRKVGYMSQHVTLYDDLTIAENLAFIASLRHIDASTYLKRRGDILEFISFTRSLDSLVKDLPSGIKQQISLAASILHDPEIVFLDEPTAGVTPAMRKRFWELIKELARQGKTIFVTTHYMDEAEQCEKITLMRTGKIVALDTPANLKKITFPAKLYEFAAKERICYSLLQELRAYKEFEYFEPFGVNFHAAFQESQAAAELKRRLSADFNIREITPTLEDVFIKLTDLPLQPY